MAMAEQDVTGTSRDSSSAAAPQAETLINPEGAELVKDPFAAYSRIREEAPLARAVLPGVEPFWLVTRHEDVTKVLSDSRFVVNVANVPGMKDIANRLDQYQLANGIPAEYVKYSRSNLTGLDGADHVRVRRLVSQVFTPRRVAELRPRVEAIAEGLLERLPGLTHNGIVDLVQHFSHPLSFTVVSDLVGVPEADRVRFRFAALEWVTARLPGGGTDRRLFRKTAFDYVRDLIELRRAEPRDDLSSALIRAHDDGDRLNDTELVWTILSLIFAGLDATVHFISNGIAALLTHGDQLALLRDNPGLMPRAVNELMRWCGPGLATPYRYATEDIEIGGGLVCKGDAIMPIIAGANYDWRVFENPEQLDITRDPEPGRKTHLGFGHGPHYCLGAALARLEAEVAFEAMPRRFPHLALAVDPRDLQRYPGGMWKLMALPVRLR